MTLEPIAWVIGLLLVALLIVIINDRTKGKQARKRPEKTVPGSTLGLVIGIVAGAGVLGVVFLFGPDVPYLDWLVGLVFAGTVLLVLVFAFRGVIWLCLKCIVAGRLPRVIRRNADGQLEIKCPRCSRKVPVTLGPIGETAFDCPHCGEKGTWASEIKS